MTKKSAIIIGAGYGGMALANLLGKSGYRVVVLEKNARAGGRIQAVHKEGYTFDLGPSWYLMPEVFDQYYELFGASATKRLAVKRFSPGYKVYFQDAEPAVVYGDVQRDKLMFENIETGAGAELERYVKKSTDAYEVSLKHFLYNNFTRLSNVLNLASIRYAPALLPLVMQSLDAHVSRRFKSLRLRQLLEYHMVFLGSSPFQAPAIYTLMSHLDFVSGVHYPTRGMQSLVEDIIDLGAAYDINYRYSAPVREIIVDNNTARGVILESGETLTADVVISNADLHHTETRLLSETHHRSYPEKYWQKRQPGPGALLVSFGVSRPLPQLLHHNLYFVKQWRQNFRDIYETKSLPKEASVYVCNPSKTDPGLAPPGRENLFMLIPIPAGVAIEKDDEATLAKNFITRFGEAIGEPELLESVEAMHVYGPTDFASQFNAWQANAFGGESHLLKQSILFRTRNASRRIRGLYYVGAGTLPGIGLPMCLIGAQLTYKRIVGDASAGPLRAEDFR